MRISLLDALTCYYLGWIDWTWFEIGKLYGPVRRVADPVPTEIPPEETWKSYPILHHWEEFSGDCQISPRGRPGTGATSVAPYRLENAAKGDWDFQAEVGNKYVFDKIRPDFDILHLGPISQNWCGRSEKGRARLREYWRQVRLQKVMKRG